MIGPITNNLIHDPAGSSALNSLSSAAFAPAGNIGASGTPSAGALLGAGDVSFTQIAQQVTQLLRSIGGGLENDQNLQMVIGLLILMTLMSQTQQSRAPLDLSSLIGHGNSGGGSISAYSSYTSISISTGDMTMTASASQIYAAISSPNGASHPTFDTVG